jgi:UPF0042 nucleotide-binding protein
MPIELIARVGELAISGSREYAGVAFIVGRSGGVQPDDWLGVERELRQLHENAKILFLDAPDDVLIHRFEGNRRRHPFEAATLAESIKGERALLQSIRDGADLVIDTGSINANQLRSRIVETFTEMAGLGSLRVSLVSFGYSNGLPRDVDLVFDCRFLPNPYWVEELRPLSGLDEPVATTCSAKRRPSTSSRRRVDAGLADPRVPKEGKSYLSIAIGCTGGRHRSVAIAEELRRRLNIEHAVFHRDIAR